MVSGWILKNTGERKEISDLVPFMCCTLTYKIRQTYAYNLLPSTEHKHFRQVQIYFRSEF